MLWRSIHLHVYAFVFLQIIFEYMRNNESQKDGWDSLLRFGGLENY